MTSKEILDALKRLGVQRQSVLDKQSANSAKRSVLIDEYSALLDEFQRLLSQSDRLHEQLEAAFKAERKRV